MAEPRGDRLVAAARRDARSAMARASDLLPFRPYVYRGGSRPPQPGAAVPAYLAAERSGTFAVGPGSGWDPLAAGELGGQAGHESVAAPPAARCKSCGYLVTASGHAVECGTIGLGDDGYARRCQGRRRRHGGG